jgi:hypothetical protein
MSLENLIVKLGILLLIAGILVCRTPRILATRFGRAVTQ